MKEGKSTHRDLFLGVDGIERIERLAQGSGNTQSEVARQALLAYELSQSLFRDTVRNAVLTLYQTCIPDEMYDPADDPRQEEAVIRLGAMLGSMYAAEGIQQAFSMLLNQHPGIMEILAERKDRMEHLSSEAFWAGVKKATNEDDGSGVL